MLLLLTLQGGRGELVLLLTWVWYNLIGWHRQLLLCLRPQQQRRNRANKAVACLRTLPGPKPGRDASMSCSFNAA
jgi:hypothetical protein